MPEDRASRQGTLESDEHRRIRDVYGSYQSDPRRRKIWADTAGSRRMREEKWRRIHVLLDATGATLAGAWGCDLGSGATADADRLNQERSPLRGIVAFDLLAERLAAARRTNAGLLPVAGDAARLPLKDGSLGIVYQSVMISSVLDPGLRRGILAEIGRVLRPGGVFVSYDTRYPNPWNRNTRPVGLKELRGGFEGWRQMTESITGIPQLLRVLARLSDTACRLVEAIPALRSHRLFVAIKPAAGAR
jgi:SAM-dependent methyltransferase